MTDIREILRISRPARKRVWLPVGFLNSTPGINLKVVEWKASDDSLPSEDLDLGRGTLWEEDDKGVVHLRHADSGCRVFVFAKGGIGIGPPTSF
jgi:hypothetical protein